MTCEDANLRKQNDMTCFTYLANGPWNKSLNFILPTKYVIPKSLKGWPLAK